LSLSDSALDDWLSKSTYEAQLQIFFIEELQSNISSPLQLLADVPTFSKYVKIWKFFAVNSIFYHEFKSGNVKNTTLGMSEQPNIDLVIKCVLYKYNPLFTISLIFSITFVKLSFNIWFIIFLCLGIFDMF
jgi:hypothetical protein